VVPQESMNFYNLVPFELKDKVLKVAITDPANLSALEALEFLGQKQNVQIQLYVASLASVDFAMGRKKNIKKVVGQALEDIEKKELLKPKSCVIC
jgi:type II secretory ATPase GspE/PulE/Tfp pilus assembly ATPase PilB-like protein